MIGPKFFLLWDLVAGWALKQTTFQIPTIPLTRFWLKHQKTFPKLEGIHQSECCQSMPIRHSWRFRAHTFAAQMDQKHQRFSGNGQGLKTICLFGWFWLVALLKIVTSFLEFQQILWVFGSAAPGSTGAGELKSSSFILCFWHFFKERKGLQIKNNQAHNHALPIFWHLRKAFKKAQTSEFDVKHLREASKKDKDIAKAQNLTFSMDPPLAFPPSWQMPKHFSYWVLLPLRFGCTGLGNVSDFRFSCSSERAQEIVEATGFGAVTFLTKVTILEKFMALSLWIPLTLPAFLGEFFFTKQLEIRRPCGRASGSSRAGRLAPCGNASTWLGWDRRSFVKV